MDTGQEPATKHNLGELEQRLTETIRDASTNVLRAFYGFAESTQKHLTDLAGLYKLSAPDRAAAEVSIPIHPAID